MAVNVMTIFPIKICPLCQLPLKLTYDLSSVPSHGYICPKMETIKYVGQADFLYYTNSQSHYSVLHNGMCFIQHAIVIPYLLTTNAYTGKTIVYDCYNAYNKIMEIPAIQIQQPDKLLNRIKLLVPFS